MRSLKEAVLGAAIGDAVGVPYEFKRRGSFCCSDMVGMGSHQVEKGTWSDDTSMMLAICDSIRQNRGRIDTNDILAKFCRWAFDGAYTCDGNVFDIGNTVLRALSSGHGLGGERDNGNGSLMRTLPLAFCDASDDEIAQVSAITHAHRLSMDSCICYVHIARDLNAGMCLREAVGRNVPNHEAFQRLKNVFSLPEAEIHSTGFVIHTLEASLWCLGTTSSYRDCILKAVNLGDDTDTTACVAGGLAGIVYGQEGIPSEWVDGLRGKELMEAWLF